MVTICPPEDAASRTVDVHGQSYLLEEFVGTAPVRGTYVDGNEVNDDHAPQGFLVTQPPGSVTPPHFHETDQFQVFVEGGGHFGKQPVSPVVVQFAGGHTPYGPIRAGATGVRYYTLRQRWDPGAKYMPQMRDRLVRGRQRQRLAATPAAGASAMRRDLDVLEVLEAEPDGLFARRYLLPAGGELLGPDPSAGGGQYQVVLDGVLMHVGREYPRHSVRYVGPEGPAPAIGATDAGLDLLVLQFPAASGS